MSEKLPPPPAAKIRATHIDDSELVVIDPGALLVRIHPLAGDHPCAWDELRAWGPTASRFDHQPPPPRTHPRRKVAYVTYGPEAFTAAIAEYFQDEGGGIGPIDRTHRAPQATVLSPTTQLRLLDLASGWVTRAGGNQAICSGPRRRAQEWARAIYKHHRKHIDGLAYPSSVWGPGRCAVLWEGARHALPDRPVATRALADPVLLDLVADASERLGTNIAP